MQRICEECEPDGPPMRIFDAKRELAGLDNKYRFPTNQTYCRPKELVLRSARLYFQSRVN